MNDLEGNLPDSIGNLANLQFLHVEIRSEWNYPLPATLGNLANLTRLELSFAGYMGGFPEGILKMQNLNHLYLGHHQFDPADSFYGSIPTSFCDLEKLVTIEFSSNALGGLEICSKKLPNLEVLSLDMAPNMHLPLQSLLLARPMLRILQISHCPVYGPLELEGQTSLEQIFISGTDISGTLPQSLLHNEKLIEIAVTSSKIGGSLPTSIERLSLLESIDLSGTLVSGTIPPGIGLCKSLSTIDVSETSLMGTLPAEIGNLSNLKSLAFSFSSIVGTVPDSFDQLLALTQLSLDGCNIEGTIPRGLLSLPNLATFTASQCLLTGTIPDEISQSCDTLVLDSNFFHGPIPSSALQNCASVSLSQNYLSGEIGNLSLNPKLFRLTLSGNGFSGSLPRISNSSEPLNLDLSSNQLVGTVPEDYRLLPLYDIDLAENQLEGEISPIIENQNLFRADLGNNRFSGEIPNSIFSSNLKELFISNNFFTGTIPPLPPQLEILSASENLLQGTLGNVFKRGGPKSLRHLDLSHNLLEGPPPPISSLRSSTFISLASNNLSGSIGPIDSQLDMIPTIRVLDLSNNNLEGQFPFELISSSITNLLLSNNSFSGTIVALSLFGQLSILDISNNRFAFDASSIASNSFLSLLSVQNNLIHGRLALSEFPSLKYADFSHNNLTKFDFDSIHQLSQNADLHSISIKNNSILESRVTFEQFISERTISLSSTTTPSVEHQGVICAHLLIGDDDKTQFEYDESIFSFQQCLCDRDHFGLPPFNCYSCETLKPGSILCNKNVVEIEQNFFVYNNSKSLQTEICVSPFLYSIDLRQGHSRISNCLGLRIQYEANSVNVFGSESENRTPTNEDSSFFPSDSQLALQCHVGSSGRLCTRCNCNMESMSSSCYFPGPAGICEKCGKVFSPNEYIPISMAAFIVVVIAMSIIFYLILASKRRSKVLAWKNLSIGKRIVYRLVDLISFGQITIMVSFVQLLVELTHWDAYALSSWLKVVNGESEGLGLRCFFPFLSSPAFVLVLRLLLPFIAIAIACMSIGFGELIHRFRSYLKLRNTSNFVSDSETTLENDSSQKTFMISSQDDEGASVSYPSMALATSTSISIIKFLYFGTTMAAVEYLFYSVQSGTNKKYVQSVPWMSFEDAGALRTISIPFLTFYLLGIPFGFVLASWKLRHKIASPSVRLYFGSLFDNFRGHLFWWELISMCRKFIVALLLRGLSPGDSLQPFFVSLILGSIGVISATVKPWKNGIENFHDGIGAVLLILSLASNLLGPLVHSNEVRIMIVVLDGVFIASCLFFIIWRTIREETSYEKEWKLNYGPDSQHTFKLVSEYGPPLLNSDIDISTTLSEWHELS